MAHRSGCWEAQNSGQPVCAGIREDLQGPLVLPAGHPGPPRVLLRWVAPAAPAASCSALALEAAVLRGAQRASLYNGPQSSALCRGALHAWHGGRRRRTGSICTAPVQLAAQSCHALEILSTRCDQFVGCQQLRLCRRVHVVAAAAAGDQGSGNVHAPGGTSSLGAACNPAGGMLLALLLQHVHFQSSCWRST